MSESIVRSAGVTATLLIVLGVPGCSTYGPSTRGSLLRTERTEMTRDASELSIASALPDYESTRPCVLVAAKGTLMSCWNERDIYAEKREKTEQTFDEVEWDRVTRSWKPFHLAKEYVGGDVFPLTRKTGLFPLATGRPTEHPLRGVGCSYGDSAFLPSTISSSWTRSVLRTIFYPFTVLRALSGDVEPEALLSPVVVVLSPAWDVGELAGDIVFTLGAPSVDVAKAVAVVGVDTVVSGAAILGDVTLGLGDAAVPGDLSTATVNTGKEICGPWVTRTRSGSPDYSGYYAVVRYGTMERSAALDAEGKCRIPLGDFDSVLGSDPEAKVTVALRDKGDRTIATRDVRVDRNQLAAASPVRATATAGRVTLKIDEPQADKLTTSLRELSIVGSAAATGSRVSLLQVSVNGVDVVHEENPRGGDLVTINRKVGLVAGKENTVVIRIRNREGQEDVRTIRVTAEPPYERYWALVVGIGKYENEDLPELAFARKDALDISSFLLDSGWLKEHVRVLTDAEATDRNIRIALDWLSKDPGPDGVVVLYWSGHGFPDPVMATKAYFATYDTNPNQPATGYSMDLVHSTLKEGKAHNVVIIADTCHAGQLGGKGPKGMSILPHMEALSRANALPMGWVYLAGAAGDRKALEHQAWGNGAFTHCLLEALGGQGDGLGDNGQRDGVVTLGEVRAYLETRMPAETQKVLKVPAHPEIYSNSTDPSIWDLSLKIK